MWSWKHGGLLACTLVTAKVHNIDIDNQNVYIYIYSSYLHEQRAQDGKLELTASLVLYPFHRFVYYINTGGSFLMTWANEKWPTDNTLTMAMFCLLEFFCFWFVLYIIGWYLDTCFQTEMNCCHHSWGWSLCIWGNLARKKVHQFLGVDFETHQDDVWDASSLLFQVGPNFLEYQSVALNLNLECVFNIVSTFNVCTAGLLLP